jgi:hypothetical protein
MLLVLMSSMNLRETMLALLYPRDNRISQAHERNTAELFDINISICIYIYIYRYIEILDDRALNRYHRGRTNLPLNHLCPTEARTPRDRAPSAP